MKKTSAAITAFLLLSSCLTQEISIYPNGQNPGAEPAAEMEEGSITSPEYRNSENGMDQGYSITGRWVFGDERINGFFFEFLDDRTLVMGSPEENFTGRYDIAYNKVPVQLNMFFEEVGEIRTIVRFLDADTVEMENSQVGMLRPVGFGDFEVLVRVEKSVVQEIGFFLFNEKG